MSTHHHDHHGEVAWITGGGSGIGRAMALEYARRALAVVVCGRRADRIEHVAAECEALGAQALALPCDVTSEATIAATVEAIVDRFGRLDVAVANAGCSVGGRIEDLDAEAWRRQLDVNVVGVALTARHAIPWLELSRGRLALTCSVSGLLCSPGVGAFHASKYAVRAIGQTLAMELAGSGVSCTTLHPGFVEKEAEVAGTRPAALLWQPEEIAPLMVDAIERREREVVLTGHGKVGAFVGRHLPELAYRAFTLGSALPRGPSTH